MNANIVCTAITCTTLSDDAHGWHIQDWANQPVRKNYTTAPRERRQHGKQDGQEKTCNRAGQGGGPDVLESRTKQITCCSCTICNSVCKPVVLFLYFLGFHKSIIFEQNKANAVFTTCIRMTSHVSAYGGRWTQDNCEFKRASLIIDWILHRNISESACLIRIGAEKITTGQLYFLFTTPLTIENMHKLTQQQVLLKYHDQQCCYVQMKKEILGKINIITGFYVEKPRQPSTDKTDWGSNSYFIGSATHTLWTF